MILTKISLKKLTDTPEVGGKTPSHAIVASDDNYDNKTEVGKLWLKTGQYGNFLSGELSKDREYEGKKYDGYVIITKKEYDSLVSSRNQMLSLKNPEPKIDYGEADFSGIPFF